MVNVVHAKTTHKAKDKKHNENNQAEKNHDTHPFDTSARSRMMRASRTDPYFEKSRKSSSVV